jgi:hypothetical protein
MCPRTQLYNRSCSNKHTRGAVFYSTLQKSIVFAISAEVRLIVRNDLGGSFLSDWGEEEEM